MTENTKRIRFRLSTGEREALQAFLGVVCGDLGLEEDDDEFEAYEKIKSELSEEEVETLKELYENVIDDEYNFPYVGSSNIQSDELPVLKHVLDLVDDSDLKDSTTMDLFSISEKIAGDKSSDDVY